MVYLIRRVTAAAGPAAVFRVAAASQSKKRRHKDTFRAKLQAFDSCGRSKQNLRAGFVFSRATFNFLHFFTQLFYAFIGGIFVFFPDIFFVLLAKELNASAIFGGGRNN